MKLTFSLLLIIVFAFAVYLFYPVGPFPVFITPRASTSPTFSPTATPTPTPTPVAIFGLMGDLGLGRHITATARTKNDFSWSFGGVSSWLTQNDFNLANLESPIIPDCPPGPTGTFTFCGDSRFLPQLKQHKYILNLANNHIFNYGQNGFAQTKNYLSNQSIPYYYSHQSDTEFTTTTINGITFGFLGFDFVTNPQFDPQIIINKVAHYHSQVDWLIVSLHWGNEYKAIPEQWRVDLAHRLVDAGADIIHGHHPHVVQPSEIYHDKPIFYSLGNFIFDQSWSYETSHSQMVRLTVNQTKILQTEVVPITIKFNSRPEID
jgi:poly-gamma-glutamate synthesis protein (capsule biosynthesis protein)